MRTLFSVLFMLLWVVCMSPFILVGFAYYHIKAAFLMGMVGALNLDRSTL